MATYKRPDIYIEEILTPNNIAQGVSTSVAAFVGATERGPANKAILVTSFDDFKRVFGDALTNEPLFYTVRSFFENGGSACYIVRLVSNAAITTGGVLPASDSIQNDGTTNFLKFSAGYRGLESYGVSGTNLSIDIDQSTLFTSNATTGDIVGAGAVGETTLQVLSISGLRRGDFIKVSDSTTAISYHEIKDLRSVVNTTTGNLEHFIDVQTSLSAVIAAGANSFITVLACNVSVLDNTGAVLETFSDLSLNPSSDLYIETVINDEETGSRFVKVDDLISSTGPSADRLIASGEFGVKHGLSNNGQDELANFVIKDDLVGDEVTQTGLYALIAKEAVNLLCVPPSLDTTNGIFPTSDMQKVHASMLSFCESRLDMFAILDAPSGKTMSTTASGSIGAYRTSSLGVDSYWGALYYPHLKIQKSSGSRQTVTVPPSGAIAGLYSRVDAIGSPNGGVASSPAGYGDLGLLRNVSELEYDISEGLHGDLNMMGVNCIKVVERANGTLPGALVLGARTLSSTDDFRYINVRRMLTYIEKTVKRIGKPYLFRNNSPRLWGELTNEITSFLSEELSQGNLAGNNPAQSFFVKIDATTNTADNIKKGVLVGEIGVALLRPAEFVVFRFSQVQSGSQE